MVCRTDNDTLALCAVILAFLALAAPAAARAWSWPVQGPVLQPFDFDELNPKAPGQHRGISIGSPTGTPVLAPVDATVTFAGTVPSGGKTLSLLTEQGLSVTLVHLGSFSVPRGATVTEGQEVGRVGPSGVSELTVPYVYLGVRRVEDPQGYLDPLRLPSDHPGSAGPSASRPRRRPVPRLRLLRHRSRELHRCRSLRPPSSLRRLTSSCRRRRLPSVRCRRLRSSRRCGWLRRDT